MLACYGEALVDLIVQPFAMGQLQAPAQACLGGSVFNFCIAAQRQGMPSSYLNALSTDSFGQQFSSILSAEGVQLCHADGLRNPTSVAIAQLDAQGKASYTFLRENVADTALIAPELIANLPPQSHALHTGCLMLLPAHWPQTECLLQHAQAQGMVITLDANLRPSACNDRRRYQDCVRQACAMAHIVKVSDDDLLALGLLRSSDVQDLGAALQAAHQLLCGHTQLIALTRGASGACLVDDSGFYASATPEGLTIQDTVGAGDSFFAALLAHLQQQHLLNVPALKNKLSYAQKTASLHHAIAAASLCIQRTGCDPATWKQTEQFLDQMTGNRQGT